MSFTKPTDAQIQEVRKSLEKIEKEFKGNSVEIRIPFAGAIQVFQGVNHRRGTPPNVVETDAKTWIELIEGKISFENAMDSGRLSASGAMAKEVERFFR